MENRGYSIDEAESLGGNDWEMKINFHFVLIGITKIQINGITINIYDKERMFIELARGKNKMGYDMYKEIIANYRKIADNLDMEKIEKYLSYFPYEDKLFEIIQDEVF